VSIVAFETTTTDDDDDDDAHLSRPRVGRR
jgi:hypothetical protein